MLRLAVRPALVLLVVFAAALGAICAQPYHRSTLHTFLSPADESCRMPCFLGVRPGVTTFPDALDTLRAHPWVGEVLTDATTPYEAAWRWNGQQPVLFASSAGGRIYRNNYNLVTSVKVQTSVPYATVWLELGTPQLGYSIPQEGGMLHGLYDRRNRVFVINFVTCPAYARQFWQNPVIIHYGDVFVALSGHYEDVTQRFRAC